MERGWRGRRLKRREEMRRIRTDDIRRREKRRKDEIQEMEG